MKYVVWFIIFLVLGAGLFVFFKVRQQNAAATATGPVPSEKVVKRDLEKVVTANGKVASNVDVEIKCQASGKVIKLPYNISDTVKPGDLLLELDPVDQQRSLDQAKAQVQAAEARLAQAKTNLEVAKLNVVTSEARAKAELQSAQARASDAKSKANHIRTLYEHKDNEGKLLPLASKEDYDSAMATSAQADAAVLTSESALKEIEQQRLMLDSKQQDIASAQAQLNQETAKRDLQQKQLDYTKVYVPDDDNSRSANYRISSLTVQIGTVVQSGSSGLNGGTTVMKLSDISHMFVLASVDESDIGLVTDPALGGQRQKARVEVDAYKGMEFEGEVVRVATTGVNTSNVVTFEVKIEVTDTKRNLLKPEMTATARIVVASRDDVLSIPMSAFTRGNNDATENAAARTANSTADAATLPAEGTASTMPATAQAGEGGRRGGRAGGRGTGRRVPTPAVGTPMDGTVQIMKGENAFESRNVTVGLSDDNYYEVIQGLQEGETVVLNKAGGDSKWRNNQNQSLVPRGVGGGNRGGR